jgi:hypothetical protein
MWIEFSNGSETLYGWTDRDDVTQSCLDWLNRRQDAKNNMQVGCSGAFSVWRCYQLTYTEAEEIGCNALDTLICDADTRPEDYDDDDE